MEEKIAKYEALKPHVFAIIDRLALELEDDPRYPPARQDLVLCLRPLDTRDRRRLNLVFRSIRKLRITQPWMTMFQIGWLRIRSIRSDQQEDMNYQISEPQYDSLVFVCREFDFDVSEVNEAPF